MSEKNGIETERKFLIRYPDAELLESIPEDDRKEIVQIYLKSSDKGVTERIRRIISRGKTRYVHTLKRRITDVSCEERECDIPFAEYSELAKRADPKRIPVVKTRYLLRRPPHVFEIDVYPFWQDRAIMEVELESEDEAFMLPPEIEVIRDVSAEKAYKNRAIAKQIPEEII